MQHEKTNMSESEIDIASFIHQAALDPHLDLESRNQICDACNHFNFSGLSLIHI